MAGQTERYDGIERYIFADVYNLFLKYKNMTNDEYHWECVNDDAKALYQKYKNHRLAREMIVATLTQLEHKLTGRVRDGLTHEQWEEKLKESHKIGW